MRFDPRSDAKFARCNLFSSSSLVDRTIERSDREISRADKTIYALIVRAIAIPLLLAINLPSSKPSPLSVCLWNLRG